MIRKWILILLCALLGLGSSAALRISLSNDRRLDEALVGLSERADEDSAARTKSRAPVKASPQAAKPAALRQRFVELATERAKRMSDEELGKAVEQITKELADQDVAAETELEKIAEQLKAVAAGFPGTSAGERASRALEAIKAKPSQAVRHPREVEDDSELSDDDPFSSQ